MIAPSFNSFLAIDVLTNDFLDLILDGNDLSFVEVTTFKFWNFDEL